MIDLTHWRPDEHGWRLVIEWGLTHSNPATRRPWLTKPSVLAAENISKVAAAQAKVAKAEMRRMSSKV